MNAGIALEGRVGDDAVLDGISGASTDSDGSDELENGTEDHSLAVGDGAGGDTGSPRIGNIVYEHPKVS